MVSMIRFFVLVFESFVILPYVRTTSRPKCCGDATEWFGVVLWLSLHGYHALVVTLASPYLEVALSGC